MTSSLLKADVLHLARSALLAEADAICAVAERLDDQLSRAVEIVCEHPGKVVISGVGKSGHIGRKIASTLSSTGTPAVFMHSTEAVHGDLGAYSPGDPTILISKSGSTAEVLRLVPTLQQLESTIIALVGNLESPLAKLADIVLDASVKREADALNLAPTCSTTVALALGDALAVALMHMRKFTNEDFARRHPAGQLGRNLLRVVAEVMHQEDAVAWVDPEAPMRELIIAMTKRPLGAACVVDADRHLLGLVTDGDLRRALLAHEDIRRLRVMDVMTREPVTVAPQARLKTAVQLMEDRPSQLSVLPVTEGDGRCLGLIRIHDIYQAESA